MEKKIKKLKRTPIQPISVPLEAKGNTFKEISMILAVTGVLINLILSTTLSSALSVLFDSSFKEPNKDTFDTIISAFRITAPLTLAIGLTLLAWTRDWFGELGRAFFFTLLLTLTTYFLMPDHTTLLKLAEQNDSSFASYTAGLVMSYILIYWWKSLLCCIVLGVSFGITSSMLLEKVFPMANK